MLAHHRRALLLLTLTAVTLIWLAASAGGDFGSFSGVTAAGPTVEAVPGELIVGFAPGASQRSRGSVIASAGATLERQLALADHSLVRVPAGSEEEYMALLLASPGVETAEPNLIRRASFDPDDTFYSFQWHFPKIGLPAAWDKTAGAGVTVAVLDTGVAYEDCPAVTCGTEFFQAPDFGSTTFVAPFDFVHGDAHPNDENGHGTHVTSTIGESTNNGTDLAGIAFAAAIMPLQILDADGVGAVADEIDAIAWAVNNGADVINLSLGGPVGSAAEEAAIDNAVANGVVVLVAAGNGGGDGVGDPVLDCPACYPSSLSIGATRFDQQRAPYSNYGNGASGHTLDMVAPGGDLSVDQNGDSWPDGVLQQSFLHFCAPAPVDVSIFALCFAQGTSMAAPHAAGVAALVLSVDPTLTPEDVRKILTGTATDLGPAGYDLKYGNGGLNAAAAVVAAQTGGGDDDGDGCSNIRELGPDPTLGGMRDPNYFWDFMDVWTGLPAARDQSVTVGDIGAVVARFGAFQDPAPSKSEALAEAVTSPPVAPAYHASFDRGGPIPGQNLWNLQPPDGGISVVDIGSVVAQFGHSCG